MRRIHEETLAKAEQVELRRLAFGLWEVGAGFFFQVFLPDLPTQMAASGRKGSKTPSKLKGEASCGKQAMKNRNMTRSRRQKNKRGKK